MADRCQMLQEIHEISFTVDDLLLYLDTHPLDGSAMEEFQKAMAKRKALLQEYAREFEPLTADLVCADANNQRNCHTLYPGQKHFTWTDGPLPWDNQGGAR